MNAPHRRFLSLKWKVLLLSTLLFGGTMSWLVLRAHTAQVRQFDRERDEARDRRTTELRAHVTWERKRLQELGEVVGGLTGIVPELSQGSARRALAAVDGWWETQQERLNLAAAHLYDREASLLGQWGCLPLGQTAAGGGSSHLDPLRNGTPAWNLRLDGPDGFLQVAVPLFDQGRTSGTLVLSSSLAGVLSWFQDAEAALDVVLLAPGEVGREANPTARPDGPPPSGPGALPHSELIAAVLAAASRASPRPAASDDPPRVEVSGRTYELVSFALGSNAAGHQVRAAIVEDVTEPLHRIRGQFRRHLFSALLGLAVGEVLLLFLVAPPMKRLYRAARVLPLLAQAKFDQVRETMERRNPHSPLSPLDETDVLEETAVSLSGQLAALYAELEDQSVALRNQMEALTEERDFVSSLLDTAQVAVLTLTREGVILMVNRFGSELFGAPLSGRFFPELLADRDQTSDLRLGLRALVAGQRARYAHEGEITTPDGQARVIAWFHAPLAGRADNPASVLTIGMDVTARKQAESRLEWLMDHDPVTSLLNRRRFELETASSVDLAKRYRRTGAVLVVDLDKFQYINDLSGHQAGDLLLAVIARNLRRAVRSVDALARLGGDEFGVLARETDEAGAMELAEKICTEIGEVSIPIDGVPHRVTASVGVALFPNQASGAREALAAAELAMYQAKDRGRAQVQLYSDTLGTRQALHQDVYWKNRVEKALTEDRFVLHFQPIQHIGTGAVSHYEALLRMIDEDGGLIPPADFISACERTGLIHSVDSVVLRKVVEHLAGLPEGLNRVHISVNLSALAFQHPDHLPALAGLFREHGVSPARLILEVTETATVADFAAARTLMAGLRDLGCALALDDFGVGFSTLGYLKELPVDYVKIDGTFVRNLPNSHDDQILLRTMVEAAKGFGKITIAEYVEDAETLALLKRFGVDYAQGYHIGKPKPAEETFGGS